ncbi:helix-turn-helix transcriptional regulator [Caulobacter sp.]|uniref:helix-turn-helix domain-containing protein n=1 Tax=Caulobacter sp. TaxID=78 RepID=UPI001B07A715|nr:helix-turn-helix transcriptional regulator [Caulobacter sp.]MBO9547129.1 helix-turn-helix transcriptional regulator [Caulobacter sp.]
MSWIARSPDQLGAIIRNLRERRGLSQTDLAELAGARQEMVSIIERGHDGAKIAVILDLLRALDTDLTVAPRSGSNGDILDVF